jgi:hypothetical protein
MREAKVINEDLNTVDKQDQRKEEPNFGVKRI